MDDELWGELEKGIEVSRHKLVIVEGQKDVASMKKLGFSRVIKLKGPLFRLVESIEDKEVVVLTDLDSEGRKLFARLSQGLQARGIKVDNTLREVLFCTALRQIEGLSKFMESRQKR